MKVKDFEYTNSEMERIIDEHIHSQRDRTICKRCFIDGITHERIAEEVDLTPRQVSNIISKNSLVIAKHLGEKEYGCERNKVERSYLNECQRGFCC